MRSARLATIVLFVSCLDGCFLGFDSRWGEAKRAQQHAATAAAPASLQTASGTESTADAPAAPTPAVRTYRIRVYATPAYATERLDWHRRATELVDDANRVLAASIGGQLVIDDFRDWTSEEQSLGASLGALRQRGDGRDIDWCLGS